MNSKKIERFLTQVLVSFLIGGLITAINYGINQKTGILIEIGSSVSKSLSLIGAVIVGLLIKRFVDYQDKVKDIELNAKAPSSVVQLFDVQKEDYFKATYRSSANMLYLAFSLIMVIICLVMPLDVIKSKASTIAFIVIDTGFTVATLAFLIFVGYEVIIRTEEARKAKNHFDKLKEMEVERQNLIEALNKSIREQRSTDVKTTNKLRENKEFDLRSYLDKLEKKEPGDLEAKPTEADE